ncbi:hypothetical protein CR162_18905 [Pseudoroseomonas rhizosphaerae]|uniref:Bacterial HORMA domain-containing protein n=2 Tax=Roseomonas TaxID=125216 RepID=A0A2C7A8N8_9PROT|nr:MULTISPECIES: hypothetical protein [Pseudoroseomonas]PHK93406.1 hypothetical protein CR162_18905 [Pseudoroseomonas rhizosphaerae]PWC26830.1 hypothetical protein CR165_20890 [Pseudoroseomonas aestuarii]
MAASYSYTESTAFTVTHARHMAAKVATDLKRMQRLYGSPSDARIAQFEAEAVELIKAGYFGTVTYGFQRDGNWIEPTLRYTARDLAGMSANDDDPGRVRPGANVSGAIFRSYLTYSAAWRQLTSAQQTAFEATLPLSRNGSPEPGLAGYLATDKTYSSGGRALDRATLRSF